MATSHVSTAAPRAETAAAAEPRSRWRQWTAAVFPTVTSGRLSRGTVIWAGLGLVVATAVNLLRTGGHGALNTIWIEDTIIFLNDAYNRPFGDVILEPTTGYFLLIPRTYAEIAGAVPIRFGAAALALQAATTWGIVAVVAFMASRPYLRQWWLRLLVAAPVVLVPVGHTQADNDISTLHFPALYALFWALLWQPRTRLGKVVAALVALAAATSSILAIVFVPLALLRLVSLRGWAARLLPSLYLAGMGLQLYGLASGLAVPTYRDPNYSPVWALKEYVLTSLPRSVLGERWLGGSQVDVGGVPTAAYGVLTTGEVVLIVVALLLVATVVACGLMGVTRPHWPLAVIATAFSIALFCGCVISMGTVQPRYVIAPALLLYVAVVAALRPRSEVAAPMAAEHRSLIPEPRGSGPGESVPEDATPPSREVRRGMGPPVRLRSAVPVIAFALLLATTCGVNYRVNNARATSPAWSDTVRDAGLYCRGSDRNAPYFFYGYEWWNILIPCDRLR